MGRNVAYGLVAVLLAVLGVHAATAMSRPFGDSHDGVNGAVWGFGSRALRTDGVVWSRMGTRRRTPDGVSTYADHPPLLVVEAASGEEVFGEHPWSTRLPAIVATALALIGAVALLRALGVGWPAAVGGVALGFGVPMVGVYGTMLDTPIVGLAPAVILLALDARARNGLRAPPVAVAIAAIVCVLSSWQGVVLAGLLAAAAALRILRKRPGPHDRALVIGGAAGVALLGAWLWWAFGSWGPLHAQLTVRSGFGSQPRSLGDVAHALRDDARRLFPVWVAVLGLVAFVVGFRDVRTRIALGVSLATVALWVFGFRDGAARHDYWPYWVVLPLAIGFGAVLETALSGAARPLPPSAAWGIAVAAVVLGAVGITQSVPAGRAQAEGAEVGRLLLRARWPSVQHDLWLIGAEHVAHDWAPYDSGRRTVNLRDPAAIRSLGEARPSDLVLFVPGAPAVAGQPCSTKLRRGARYALLPAAETAKALAGGVIRPC
ncbi:MAG: glycosyltransferase family 39 protein [Acidimicrobiia bacterium]|nr:glycosyltransferase family 39 protein [Acidimicrobiia bacterium]